MPTVRTPRGFCLGKLPARPPVLPYLSHYATASGFPAPPAQAHFGGKVKLAWGMDANGPDSSVTIMGPDFQGVGDCVEAASAHAVLMSNYDEDSDTVTVPTANGVVRAYCSYLGCTPAELEANENLDQGTDIQTWLTNWAKSGDYFGITLDAWAPLQTTDRTQVTQGIAFTDAVLIGLNLPESAEAAFPDQWTVVAGSPILGGHCVMCAGFDARNVYFCTWGELEIDGMTWDFFDTYVDEAYALILPQAVKAGAGPDPGYGASAVDLAALKTDIAAL